jgi:hypothetical protein
MVSPREHESMISVFDLEQTYRTVGAGGIGVGICVIIVFVSPPYMAFVTIAYHVDRICRLIGSPRLAPYFARPCMATWLPSTTAHHEEVGVSENGHASAPPSTAVAAVPPAGAV